MTLIYKLMHFYLFIYLFIFWLIILEDLSILFITSEISDIIKCGFFKL